MKYKERVRLGIHTHYSMYSSIALTSKIDCSDNIALKASYGGYYFYKDRMRYYGAQKKNKAKHLPILPNSP